MGWYLRGSCAVLSREEAIKVGGPREPRLLSKYHDSVWVPGERFVARCPHSATCCPDVTSPCHLGKQCNGVGEGCGVYAVRERCFLRGASDEVYGMVALWGRVYEHTMGYRAQYAYPLRICGGYTDVKALAQVYGVPHGKPDN